MLKKKRGLVWVSSLAGVVVIQSLLRAEITKAAINNLLKWAEDYYGRIGRRCALCMEVIDQSYG